MKKSFIELVKLNEFASAGAVSGASISTTTLGFKGKSKFPKKPLILRREPKSKIKKFED